MVGGHSLSLSHGEISYDHKRGWAGIAQPIPGWDNNGYHELAKASAPIALQEAKSFLEQQNLKYIVISHEAFRDSYLTDLGETREGFETSAMQFRPWFEQYCKDVGINRYSQFDVCIVGSSIKSLISSNRKAEEKNISPDRIKDHLRLMFVALKRHARTHENVNSLSTLQTLIQRIEENERTLAHKNNFWMPNEDTGFRGHKSAWLIKPGDDYAVPNIVSEVMDDDAEIGILCECKIEHESQMDVDKFTRKLMDIQRTSKKSMFNAAFNTLGKLTGRVGQQDRSAEELRRILFNYVCQQSGFSQLMNPNPYIHEARHEERIERFHSQLTALPLNQSLIEVASLISKFPSQQQNDIIKRLVNSGIFPELSAEDLRFKPKNQ